ncbi:hypothetical protein [Flagellimonas lutaonensis]|uniref:Lipoprotein n=1 Tax=Flagellimonas lutaonensis TaxID=516051 RepID=A0A0D5YS03_9FLAO|nr:hypothetical protein [Allomuricauda lutaonensis]AKA34694.1 hypothetical protein VC82_1048 [Allomuricauda lutaonensis]
MSKTLQFLTILFLLSCGLQDFGKLEFVAKLPSKMDESSGIAVFNDSTIWTIEDNGNADNIYQIDIQGNLLTSFDVKDAKNNDWEDLATDGEKNVYIGDFGNNNNKRKDLVIYKLPNPEIEKGDRIDAVKIRFKYPEQTAFPPSAEKLFYDAEAFFHYGDSLYIITKNRSRPFNGKAMVYQIPDTEGNYKAKKIGSFAPCEEEFSCVVTSADISKDGKKVVLLGYGKLWVFTDFAMPDFTKGKMRTVDLQTESQLEAVAFLNDSTLLLTDERGPHSGGNIYRFKLPKD